MPNRTLNHDKTLTFNNVETLERRQMMAGNVTVSMSTAGDLTISGDQLDNQVSVRETSMFTNGAITDGVEIRGFDGTTINGEQSLFLTAPNSGLRDVRISMKGGSDFVEMENVSGRHLSANMGSGTDLLHIKGGSYMGNARVILGASDADHAYGDSLGLLSSDVAGRQGVSLSHAQIQGHLRVNGGSGSDRVSIRDSNASRVTVRTVGGDDWVDVLGSTLNQKMSITTAAGNDEVTIGNSDISAKLQVSTGGGNDVMTLTNGSADSISIGLGSGDDVAVLPTPITVANTASINGGGGTNVRVGSGDQGVQTSRFEGATESYTANLPETRTRTETYTVMVPEMRTRIETYVDENGVTQTREVTYTVFVPQTRIRQVTQTVLVPVSIPPQFGTP